MNFTWAPFYQELAQKIAEYDAARKDLLGLLLDALNEQEMSTDWLQDKDVAGTRIPLDAIDPFTFFAAFNRGISEKNRIGILTSVHRRLQLSAEVPSDFHGIPVVDNRNTWFFAYQDTRPAGAIDDLWGLFLECIGKPAVELTAEVFERVVRAVGLGKTTMGLFWVNPEQYLSLDGVMQAFIKDHVPKININKATTLGGYAEVVSLVQAAFPGKRFCDVSLEAWMSKSDSRRAHWVMALGEQSEFWDDCQAKGIVRVGWDSMNADLGKLSEGELRKLNQHSKAGDYKGIREFVRVMKPGDRVFIKRGTKDIIAYGEIAGDYYFEPDLDEYRHTRPARWLKTGNWHIPEGMTKLPVKTLTPTGKESRTKELLSLIDWKQQGPGGDPAEPISLPSLNVILYGPPGTGKTYTLKEKFFPLFSEKKTKTKEQFARELVSALSWWEVLAAAMYDFTRSDLSVSEILDHLLLAAKVQQTRNKHPRAAVWATLQSHTKEECAQVNYSRRVPPLLFSKGKDSRWSVDREMVKNELPDIAEVCEQLKSFTPIETDVCRYKFVTFHQSFCYEDFVEGIKPEVRKEGEEAEEEQGKIVYIEKKGVFWKLAEEARQDPAHPYALFIDEINRGNVASIFGELITLIEDDKRLGPDGNPEAPGAWTVTLPYSREKFGVPRNLHIIGTMNTADRSVEALDTALRRRFSFVAKFPEPEILKEWQPAGFGVDLERLLTVINQRLELLLDKDHTIGHSYLMGLRDTADPLAELRRSFSNKILPLLQEFFYGNPARIGMVLGNAFVQKKDSAPGLAQGDWDLGEAEDQDAYDFTDPKKWTLETFQKIYA